MLHMLRGVANRIASKFFCFPVLGQDNRFSQPPNYGSYFFYVDMEGGGGGGSEISTFFYKRGTGVKEIST